MAATTYKDSNDVVAGVGTLYVAPLGTAEPISATATLDSAWREIGYTDTGATISSEVTVEAIEVAEEYEPIKYVQTSRTGTLSFAMAQATVSNLALALNLGATIADNVPYIEPPSPGDDLSVMLLLDTEQGGRWLFYSGKNGSNLELARQKTGKTLIPVEFSIEKVTGKALFRVYPNANGLI